VFFFLRDFLLGPNSFSRVVGHHPYLHFLYLHLSAPLTFPTPPKAAAKSPPRTSCTLGAHVRAPSRRLFTPDDHRPFADYWFFFLHVTPGRFQTRSIPPFLLVKYLRKTSVFEVMSIPRIVPGADLSRSLSTVMNTSPFFSSSGPSIPHQLRLIRPPASETRNVLSVVFAFLFLLFRSYFGFCDYLMFTPRC